MKKNSISLVIISSFALLLVFGIAALLFVTAVSMYTPQRISWVYPIVLAFCGACFILTTHNKHITKSSENKLDSYLNKIYIICIIQIILLIILNLVSTLHNANLIDEFIGIEVNNFDVGSFWGHLILEIIYFITLYALLDDLN